MTDDPDDRFRRADPGYHYDDFDPEEDHEFPRWAIGLGVAACVGLVAFAGWMML